MLILVCCTIDVVFQVDRTVAADSPFGYMARALVEKVSDMAVAVYSLASKGLQVVWLRGGTKSGRSTTSVHVPVQR